MANEPEIDFPAPPRPRWRLERGARVLAGGGVRFRVWAPHPARVALRLWRAPGAPRAIPTEPGAPRAIPREPGAPREVAMERGADDVWEVTVPDARPHDDYVFVLDGERERPDPVSRWQPAGVHGPSRVVDPAVFRWTDGDWRGIELADMALYELHVGTFSRSGTFAGARERLDELADLGVNALELMPLAQFPGERNWGYDGALPYAVQASYGGPDELRALVDAAHARGLAVLVDAVYNHFGPEGSYQRDFGPYTTDAYRTPWGEAINLDGPGSDEVRRYFVDNALCWIAEYHLDGLRLDAVHAFHDRRAVHFLEELALAVRALERDLGRRVVLVAESDLNDPRVVRSRERGGYGLDAQWSDDFHHAVHAALTGEERGYYTDFAGPDRIGPLYKALSDRFVLDGGRSRFRGRRHGAPALDVPRERFVVYVQNHDQVGNRAAGDRFGTLLSERRQRLAAGLLLLAPFVPLVFMGEEHGATRPFPYFTSHGDPALAEAVREGRQREFEAFAVEGAVPDPQAEETLESARLAPDERGAAGLERRALYRALLRERRAEPALAPGRARVEVRRGAEWIAVRSVPVGPRAGIAVGGPDGAALLALFHLGERAETAELAGWDGAWEPVLSTEEPRFGGERPLAELRAEASARGAPVFPLPPESAVLWRCA